MALLNELRIRLEKKKQFLSQISRGIERETLRIDTQGELSTQPHPIALGSTLSHPYITTDFAEAMLEFVTPVYQSIDKMMQHLTNIHRVVAQNIGDELLWPASMPCYISNQQDIPIAQYGTSNAGRLKMLYREGLKNRYGASMQLISGIHYNFSLPEKFWQQSAMLDSTHDEISAGYLHLVRNYYRFGWVIPYLFGSSPILCRSFLAGNEHVLPFEELSPQKGIYLPYATSLRMSNLGYTSTVQEQLNIKFNRLDEYLHDLRRATHIPHADFQQIGLKVDGQWRQINSNILQLENEYYAPIRPKRVVIGNERLSDAMQHRGIQYIEVRALDVNPYSSNGINADQVRFLDLFLIWCSLKDSPDIDDNTMKLLKKNWQAVILEGRYPQLTLWQQEDNKRYSVQQIGQQLCEELDLIAQYYDAELADSTYQAVCNNVLKQFNEPELTLSAKILNDVSLSTCGIGDYLMRKAYDYKQHWLSATIPQQVVQHFNEIAQQSIVTQRQLESSDTQSFDAYLAPYQL